jgi:tryptophan-rich sensory protein
MRKLVVYLLFVAAVVAIGSTIGLLNIPGDWYQSLQKPWFNPPNWVFGPAWTVLYGLVGLAGARTWLSDRHSRRMTLWWAQMLLNFLWSPAFFGLQNPTLALIVILPLLVSILLFILLSWRRDRAAALLFMPYLLWVAYATALNGSIVYLN